MSLNTAVIQKSDRALISPLAVPLMLNVGYIMSLIWFLVKWSSVQTVTCHEYFSNICLLMDDPLWISILLICNLFAQQMLNWEQFWNLRMGAPLSGGRGIVAASSGLNVGGPPNEGFSRT